VDARSDIFSLGEVVYEMFAGKRAPGDSNLMTLASILRDPRRRSKPPGRTRRRVERILARALEKPEDGTPAVEMRDDLAACQAPARAGRERSKARRSRHRSERARSAAALGHRLVPGPRVARPPRSRGGVPEISA
jgi:serine/threonine protein kinase